MLNGFPSVICGLVLSSFSTAVVCARYATLENLTAYSNLYKNILPKVQGCKAFWVRLRYGASTGGYNVTSLTSQLTSSSKLGTWGITALNHYQVYVAPDLPRSTINTIPVSHNHRNHP